MTGRERIRVLVADHDRWTRLSLSAMLDEAGFRVEQASNGVAALRIAETAQPRIVLIGHDLPELGAADVLTALKADSRNRRCAVVQLLNCTAADSNLDVDGRLDLPCHPIELLAAVMHALEARRAARGGARRRQLAVGAPMRSVSASARGPMTSPAVGGAQATSSIRNVGRSGKCRFNNDIETL